MEPNFWLDINTSIYKEFKEVASQLNNILAEAFNCDTNEQHDFLANYRDLVKKETKIYVKERAKMLPDDVMRKFKKLFERDEKGGVRDWVAMEPKAIRDIWL